MELILLSGNSVQTKEWIESVEKRLNPVVDSTYLQYYKHWTTGENLIDIDYELEQLQDYLSDKKDFVIFAKSAGSAVVVKGVVEGKIFPKGCIFAGFPISWCHAQNIPIENMLEGYKVPSIFIQNSQDPAIDAKSLKELLDKLSVKNFRFCEINGNDHHYGDLEVLKNKLKELLDFIETK